MDPVELSEVRVFMDSVPFNQLLGLRIEELARGLCRMALPFREVLIGDPQRRALHGGVLSAVMDTCGGAAVWTQIDRGDRLSTVDLRVDYLRPGLPEELFVEARVLRLGNRVGVASMSAFHSGRGQEPVATGTAVYNVRRAPKGARDRGSSSVGSCASE